MNNLLIHIYMETNNTKFQKVLDTFSTAGKTFEKVGPILEKTGPLLDKLAEIIKNVFQSFTSQAHPNLICVDKQFVNQANLIEIAKKYKVPKATAVAAIFEKGEKHCYIKLAYLIDRELLPEDENKFINITSEGVARDIEVLFDNNKCIILK